MSSRLALNLLFKTLNLQAIPQTPLHWGLSPIGVCCFTAPTTTTFSAKYFSQAKFCRPKKIFTTTITIFIHRDCLERIYQMVLPGTNKIVKV